MDKRAGNGGDCSHKGGDHGAIPGFKNHRPTFDTRAFPLLMYDPRKGDTIKKRLSLQGNLAVKEDWWKNPKTGEVVDFIDSAEAAAYQIQS